MKRTNTYRAVLAAMGIALLAAALLCLLGAQRRAGLTEKEKELRGELYEVTDGENGYNTVVRAKNALEEERDNLQAEIREMKTNLADTEGDAETIRNQLTVIGGYRDREQAADVKTAVYREAVERTDFSIRSSAALLAADPEKSAEVRGAVDGMENGAMTPEEALEALRAFGTAAP